MTALYGVISGPAGEKRDWDRFRHLFHADARLTVTIKRGAKAQARAITPQQYTEMDETMFAASGFFESELHRITESFGPLVHVWSTYDSRRTPGEQPFDRGVNSIQLLNDGERWWILAITWAAESSGEKLPAKYLPAGG